MFSDRLISFSPLAKADFALLHKWLLTPHVRAHWDNDVNWTMDIIQEKYGTYIRGYKLVDRVKKPMYAYIIYYDGTPIGYIQMYNVHDFPREQKAGSLELPASCAGLDFYIGEEAYLGKGLGSTILKEFLAQHVWPHYASCLVDPNTDNIAAIRTYENAGFKSHETLGTTQLMIMYRNCTI